MSADPVESEGIWEAVTDKESGRVYYAHSKTLETRWEPPPGVQIVSRVEQGEDDGESEGQLIEELSNGWAKLYDPATNKHYYANKDTGETQWTPPAELSQPAAESVKREPKDYERVFDEDSGRFYFVNKYTLAVSWEPPVGWVEPKASGGAAGAGEDKSAGGVEGDSPVKDGPAPVEGGAAAADLKTRLPMSISSQLRRHSEDGGDQKDGSDEQKSDDDSEVEGQDAAPMTPRKGKYFYRVKVPGVVQPPPRPPKAGSGSPPPIPDHLKKKLHPPPRPLTPRQDAEDKEGPPGGLPPGLKNEIVKYKLSDRAVRSVAVRKGLLKQNTVTVDKVLAYQSTLIKKSLLTSAKKFNEKALKNFKYIMQFMGDMPTKRSLGELAQLIVSTGIQVPQIRDEIFCQITKQTRDNPKLPSVLQGWKLMALCVAAFPPSRDFQDYLTNYIAQNYDGTEYEQIKGKELISILAPWCYWRLNKTLLDGAAQHPLTLMDIDKLIQTGPPSHSVIFGASLDYIMTLQKSEGSELKYPAVLPILCDSIRQLGGFHTKGIFRIAAEKSNIVQLKQQLERGDLVIRAKSCHIPADVLKIFLRELREPLIPTARYFECMAACDDSVKCLNIALGLHDTNRNTLSYLLEFLAELATHAEETSMAPENIAIVFCSDILRPAQEHPPGEQLKYAAKEKIFVRHLVEAWIEKLQKDGQLPRVDPKDFKSKEGGEVAAS